MNNKTILTFGGLFSKSFKQQVRWVRYPSLRKQEQDHLGRSKQIPKQRVEKIQALKNVSQSTAITLKWTKIGETPPHLNNNLLVQQNDGFSLIGAGAEGFQLNPTTWRFKPTKYSSPLRAGRSIEIPGKRKAIHFEITTQQTLVPSFAKQIGWNGGLIKSVDLDTMEVKTLNAKLPALSHPFSIISHESNIFILGQLEGSNELSVFRFDVDKQSIEKISSKGDIPKSPSDLLSGLRQKDSALFIDGKNLQLAYNFDTKTGNWTTQEIKNSVGSISCSGPSLTSITASDGKEKLLFLNGLYSYHNLAQRQYISTIRVIDLETMTWENDAIVGGETAPEPRACSSVLRLTGGNNNNKILLLGGLNDRRTFLDMFMLELDSNPIPTKLLKSRTAEIRPVFAK